MIRYALNIPPIQSPEVLQAWQEFLDAFSAQFILRRLGKAGGIRWLSDELVAPHPWLEAWGKLMVEQVAGRRIHIFGDYDADGLAATALLQNALSAHAKEVFVHLQNRGDGYGAPIESVTQIYASDPTAVLFFVDNGTHLLEDLSRIREKGGTVFVIDHHRPDEKWQQLSSTLEIADWVLNPYILPRATGITLDGMTSASLAFWATAAITEPTAARLLLAALGIVGDVGSARNIGNHSILKAALKNDSAETAPPFWKAIRSSLPLAGAEPFTLAMQVVPLLNAAGRIGNVNEAYAFLSASEEDRAMRHLVRLQAMKQQIDTLTREWRARLDQESEVRGQVNVFYHPELPVGIISSLAAQVLNDTNGDIAIIMGRSGQEVRGSVRTKRNVDAVQLLRTLEKQFPIKYGGHPRAAGFVLPVDYVGTFIEWLRDLPNRQAENNPLEPPGQNIATTGSGSIDSTSASDVAAGSQPTDTDETPTRTWQVDVVLDEPAWGLIFKADYNAMGPFIPNDESWAFPRVLLTGVTAWRRDGKQIIWKGRGKVEYSAVFSEYTFFVSEAFEKSESPEDRAVLLIASPGRKFAMGMFSLSHDVVQTQRSSLALPEENNPQTHQTKVNGVTL